MSRYEINATGDEVKDNETGLIWARCSVGQEWNGKTCSGEPSLMNYNDAIEYASNKTGWRMPTVEELESLIDRRCFPAIDNTVFPGNSYNWCWSASPYAGSRNNAWGVSFNSGNVNYDYRYYGYAVRLVKSGE